MHPQTGAGHMEHNTRQHAKATLVLMGGLRDPPQQSAPRLPARLRACTYTRLYIQYTVSGRRLSSRPMKRTTKQMHHMTAHIASRPGYFPRLFPSPSAARIRPLKLRPRRYSTACLQGPDTGKKPAPPGTAGRRCRERSGSARPFPLRCCSGSSRPGACGVPAGPAAATGTRGITNASESRRTRVRG